MPGGTGPERSAAAGVRPAVASRRSRMALVALVVRHAHLDGPTGGVAGGVTALHRDRIDAPAASARALRAQLDGEIAADTCVGAAATLAARHVHDVRDGGGIDRLRDLHGQG